jgi:Arc/MetJ-type ribon-helix-helix transcriptional regulator
LEPRSAALCASELFSSVQKGLSKGEIIEAMTVELTPEVERMVREGLRRGHYRTAAELISEAVQQLLAQEEWFDNHRSDIGARIEAGWASAEHGESIDSDRVKNNLETRKRAFLAETRRA